MKHRSLLIDGRPLALSSVGMGVYTARLCRGLLLYSRDFDFKVLLPKGTDSSKHGIPTSRVIEIPIPMQLGNKYLDGIISDIALSLFIRRNHPEALFHATTPFWSPFRLDHVVVTMHDVIPRRFPRYFGRTPLRRLMQGRYEAFAASSNRVLAVSHCTARDLTELAGIPAEKISVLYNWVEKEFTNFDRTTSSQRISEMRKKLGLPDSYWLYMGGYDYRKNVELLLQSYSTASKQATLPPLVLGGAIPTDLSKPYCDVMGALRDTNLSQKAVIMPGHIEESDLPLIYAEASLVIYPSLYEGFGYPAAEAMAVGTPVLESDSSSLPEVVGRRECRFDPNNPAELTAKLLQALATPETFVVSLPEEFTGAYAINRYVRLLQSIEY